MKRRDRDEIMDLAFGELSPDAARRVAESAKVDARMAQDLRDAEAMRDALLELRAVPDDQLSVERLRAAVLDRGLQPHPARNWVWLPAAVACFAVAVVATRSMLRPHVTGSALGPPPMLGDIPKFAANFGADVPDLIAGSRPIQRKSTNGSPRIAAREKSARLGSRRTSSTAQIAAVDGDPSKFVVLSVPAATSPPAASSDVPMASPEGSAASAPAQPVVLIDAGKDKGQASNVNNATEVESGTNVIVSG